MNCQRTDEADGRPGRAVSWTNKSHLALYKDLLRNVLIRCGRLPLRVTLSCGVWRLRFGAVLLTLCATTANSSSATWVLEDAERFAALLGGSSLPDAAGLQTDYLTPGSRGIAIFTPHRIVSANNLAAQLAASPQTYRHAAGLCLPVARQFREQAEALTAQVGALLGEKNAVSVYVIFGAMNSGGTADAQGLVLGLEVICQQAKTAEDAAQILRDFVAHEVTHVYQSRAGAMNGQNGLLRQVLVEGFADFVMEMATGSAARAGADRARYGLQHEARLWAEFQMDRAAGKVDTDWLYRQSGLQTGRPADLGYWIGKRICEAYYARASNKPVALRTLLALRSPESILIESGYGLALDRP